MAGFTVLYALLLGPAVLDGKVLAPGDGALQGIPAFVAEHSLWTPFVFSGFPTAADPQAMSWYPVARALPSSALGYSLFVVLAYLFASCLQYAFVYAVSGSRVAAAAAGAVFGLSGFFVAHMGTVNAIHAAAWAPLLLWMLERLRRDQQRVLSTVVAALAVTLCALAGHPQTLSRVLVLAGLFALLRASQRAQPGLGPCSFLGRALAAVCLGLGAAAVLLVPMWQLAGLSARPTDFAFFSEGSFPVWQLPTLLFPDLLGSWPTLLNATPYFGDWFVCDLAVSMGMGSLILAIVALRLADDRRLALFLGGLAAISLLLALGDATPLARLVYAVPVLRYFRVPARYFFEFSWAVSVLGGLGIASLHRVAAERRWRALGSAAAVVAGLVAAALVVVAMARDRYLPPAAQLSQGWLDLLWQRPIWLPLLLAAVVFSALLWWSRRPSRLRSAVLLWVIVLELVQFGWLHRSEVFPATAELLHSPLELAPYREEMLRHAQRFATLRGANQRRESGVPNLSWVWGLPNASGYNPLILRRYAEAMQIRRWGAMERAVLAAEHRGLDLLAVRYLMVPNHHRSWIAEPRPGRTTTDAFGLRWAASNLDISLGQACGRADDRQVELDLPDIPATELGFVSALSCARTIADDRPLLDIELLTSDGTRHTLQLTAGRDTAEWAIDRPDLAGQVAHRRAPVFSSELREDHGESYPAHRYVKIFSSPRPVRVARLTLRWLGGRGAISIAKISLHDRSSGDHFVVDGAQRRWRAVGEAAASTVYENRAAMPRVWAVSELVQLGADQILQTIRSSRLPDGRPFDLQRTALVEEEPDGGLAGFDPDVELHRLELANDSLSFATRATGTSFVVVSEPAYPGWRVSIDGEPATWYRANYLLRGVVVPPGEHLVRFTFVPGSLRLGKLISLACMALLCAYLVVGLVNSRRSSQHR